jgi:hypothetical protein
MLVWLEIKKYLLAYRSILLSIAAAVIICGVIGAGAAVLLSRGTLFEPFTVGVVDSGNSPEVRFIFDFFNDTVSLKFLEKAEAERMFASGEIPAYVELPEQFATDVRSGANSPLILHGNADYPLQLALTRLLASGGVAFLSASQAGVFATSDQAYADGMPWDEVQRRVVIPINVEFMQRIFKYDEFFTVEVLPLTEGTPFTNYVYSFAAFLFILNLLPLVKTMGGYKAGIYARYKLAGMDFFTVQSVRLLGSVAVHGLLTVPLFIFATKDIALSLIAGLGLAFCVSALGLMASALFSNETGAGLFIFLTGMFMLFISGGIIPLAFLPQGLHMLRYAGIPFWAVSAANGNFSSAWMLTLMGLVFWGVALLAERMRSK